MLHVSVISACPLRIFGHTDTLHTYSMPLVGWVECPGPLELDAPTAVVDDPIAVVDLCSDEVVDLCSGENDPIEERAQIPLAGPVPDIEIEDNAPLSSIVGSHALPDLNKDDNDGDDDDTLGNAPPPCTVLGWPAREVGKPHMLEVYSRPRIVPFFCEKGGTGASVDITTGWDALQWEDRSRLFNYVEETKPDFLSGCPPCTMYSNLQHSNKRKMSPGEYDEKLENAHTMLDLAMELFKLQSAGGRGFLFEHPLAASSWNRASVRAVAQLPGTYIVKFDQCRYSLKNPRGQLIKKPTKIMFNVPSFLHEFTDKKCICTERHAACQGRVDGVSIAAMASVYPPKLASAFAACAWLHVTKSV